MRFVNQQQRAAVAIALRLAREKFGGFVRSPTVHRRVAIGTVGLIAANPDRDYPEVPIAARYGLAAYGAHRLSRTFRGRTQVLRKTYVATMRAPRIARSLYEAVGAARVGDTANTATHAAMLAAKRAWQGKASIHRAFIAPGGGREAMQSAFTYLRRVRGAAGFAATALPVIGAGHIGYRLYTRARSKVRHRTQLQRGIEQYSAPVVVSRPHRPTYDPRVAGVIQRQHDY